MKFKISSTIVFKGASSRAITKTENLAWQVMYIPSEFKLEYWGKGVNQHLKTIPKFT